MVRPGTRIQQSPLDILDLIDASQGIQLRVGLHVLDEQHPQLHGNFSAPALD
jgi:hypothetical protein